ncbi:9717_t:CDS:2 [Cetraspora pellucida]|uniref:9717_t:CDS:1 n=1 Tax=Cetraspora pellucida TaxID=1433469 RepID=A0ACA9L6S0_9GLOM|nr:9717_t:CDS:2 [Cetraspora pellucida]
MIVKNLGTDQKFTPRNVRYPELEVTTVSRKNHRGRGRPRLTRTNQSANNSHGSYDKCGKHDQTIVNCWRKTRILSSIFREEIEVTTYNHDISLEQQEDDIGDLVIDLTSQDPDLEIKSQLNTYLDLNDLHIITKKKLKDLEIIEIVLDEENQRKNRDPDDSDEEQPEIPISEGLMGLNKFITFFEQQIDTDFKAENLKIFENT